MAYSYRPVDRSQSFLLPPNMGDWLPEDHLVWLVIDVVGMVDTGVLHDRHPRDGVGRRAYDPDMLLGLLLYSYCLKVRSSRQIERLCGVDVAYRLLCAGDIPDHTTIARFRQAHEVAAKRLFREVLAVCGAAGLATVGVVAVDGTKMAGNASKKANRTRAQIEAEVEAMFADAEKIDEFEDGLFGDARGDELPPGLRRRRGRKERLDAALAEVEAQEAAREAAAEDAEAAAREAETAAREAGGVERVGVGLVPVGRPHASREVARAEAHLERVRVAEAVRRKAVEESAARRGDRRGLRRQHPEGIRVAQAQRRLRRALARQAARERKAAAAVAEVRANTTDPDSRLMKTRGGGWLQGYNAQIAVNEAGLVLAACATRDHNDLHQYSPMVAATLANLAAAGIEEPVGTMLFDAGYLSEANLTEPGPDRLIATGKSWKMKRTAKQNGYATGDPPPDASPIEAMEHRLMTEHAAALYDKRQCTVEPVFGQTKHNRGITRFTRRGLKAVDAEWQLIATTHNILKLHRHANPQTT